MKLNYPIKFLFILSFLFAACDKDESENGLNSTQEEFQMFYSNSDTATDYLSFNMSPSSPNIWFTIETNSYWEIIDDNKASIIIKVNYVEKNYGSPGKSDVHIYVPGFPTFKKTLYVKSIDTGSILGIISLSFYSDLMFQGAQNYLSFSKNGESQIASFYSNELMSAPSYELTGSNASWFSVKLYSQGWEYNNFYNTELYYIKYEVSCPATTQSKVATLNVTYKGIKRWVTLQQYY